jgi:spermidine/putrescine ABC transporter ATP-binding subunit
MADLVHVEGLVKRFGSTVAVDGVSLAVRENEFFALLGPSGCGKTTLLRMLAGFETPDAGRLVLDGQDLVGVKPYRRPLNMMFQSYALFPHMSVADNVAYGLKMAKVPRGERDERAREALAMVQLEALEARRPAQLSGGQRQRVALARALVNKPKVLLLDEPLSALDRQIRAEMQVELKRLQHQVGITFVVVTHDQEEALTMADRIAVMRDGRVEQVDTPDGLYERPATRFVARFLGEANLFAGRVSGEAIGPWRVEATRLRERGLGEGDDALVVVRPERMRIGRAGSADGAPAAPNAAPGRVAEVVYLGTARKYVVDLEDGQTVQARVPAGEDRDRLTAGDEVLVGWDVEDGVVVAAEERRAATEPVAVHA